MSPLRVHPPSGYVRVPPPSRYLHVPPLLLHLCSTHLFTLRVYVLPECLVNLCLLWQLRFKYLDSLLQVHLIVILGYRLNHLA